MVFASAVFLFAFMPAAVLTGLLARASGKAGLRNAVLLVFSLLFYAWGEPVYVFLMIFEILLNAILARIAEKKKWASVIAVVVDLGILFFFKYLRLFLESVNLLFGTAFPLAEIAMPIGISFYTFQILSYVVDVRRGEVKASGNLLELATYVAMFPQLIAGPIVRYRDVQAQLTEIRGDINDAADGVRRFCRGLAKKALLANLLAQIADNAFQNTGRLTVPAAWLGIIAYSLQIYFDFSGYSDMAIGLGSMFGFRFRENFDMPYRAGSVREFWRRWHISLSGWFRDYVYIPLGGNRRGKARTLLNLIIVFALCGLWHGAEWTFLAWGLWHGFFLALERLAWVQWLQKKLPAKVGWLYTSAVVLAGWILFRAESFQGALAYAENLFHSGTVAWNAVADVRGLLILALGILISLVRFRKPEKISGSLWTAGSTVFSFILLALSAIALAGGTYNPFIYFRF